MLIRFWGTRGSVPTPGAATLRYGGNTSCVEVRAGETLAVLDCGTGARALGAALAAEGGHLEAHLLLTHFHWDHIQGFPFFLPVFMPGSAVHVYGAPGLEQGLEEAMAGQMQYTYFPVRLSELRSQLMFHEVGESVFQAGDLTVHTHFLNHTCPTVGYRLAAGGTTLAYITDHEPFWPHTPDAALEEVLVHPGDQQHMAFAAGADLLIHDAQYTAKEYPSRRGWGHSTLEYVVDVAVAAGVRRLALFHHDPQRDDQQVEQSVARAQERVTARGGTLEVFAAAEGDVVELPEGHASMVEAPALPLVVAAPPARVLLLGSPERRRQLREALVEDGYRLSEAGLDHPSAEWPQEAPELVLVAPPPEVDVAAVIRAESLAAKGRPVIAVLEGTVDEPLLRRVGEVAADVVVMPFALPNLRARVRASLARRQPAAAVPRTGAAARAAALENLQLVDRLPTSELEAMLQTAARCGFRPGEVLFNQGDPAGGVYYLHGGLVRIAVAGPAGQEVTVGFAGPGDTVGEMSALDEAPRSATAVVLEPVEASYVSREMFRQTLERAPQTSVRLLRLLARRLRDVDQRLASGAPVDVPGEAGDENHALRQRLGRLQALLSQLELTEAQLEGYSQEVQATYLRVREWRQAVQALRAIADLLRAARDPRALARQAVRTLVRLVPAEGGALYVAETQGLVRLAAQGRGAPRGWAYRQEPQPVAAALRLGTLQVSAAERAGDRAPWLVVVPLRAHGQTLGVLWLRRAAPLTEDDRALAEVVAAACAVAWGQSSGNGKADVASRPLAQLQAALDVEVERARRLGYPLGVLLGQVGAQRSTTGRGSRLRTPATLAPAVRRALRRTDVVAASGEGAVAAILPGLAPEHLSAVETRVQEALHRALHGGRNDAAVRLGGSVISPQEADAHQLLERAREALRDSEPKP